MSTLKVHNSRRFGVVPDSVLEDQTLSLETRAVAAWLAGRSDGFEIRVEAMRTRFLGVSEKRWRSIRKDMEVKGWWRSSKAPTGPRGRFEWTHEFSLEGFSTILPLSTDAQSTHAVSKHAQGQDNQEEVNQEDFHQQEYNHLPTSKKANQTKAEEGGASEGFENKNQDPTPQDVVDATRWAMRSSTHPMGAGLEHTIRMRWAAGKAGGEYREIDLDTVARWRKAQLETERKAQAADAIARRNSKEGTGIENLVGRRFLVSTSGAIVVGKHYGITIGTKLTPTPKVLQMIADGLLVELHDEEVAA